MSNCVHCGWCAACSPNFGPGVVGITLPFFADEATLLFRLQSSLVAFMHILPRVSEQLHALLRDFERQLAGSKPRKAATGDPNCEQAHFGLLPFVRALLLQSGLPSLLPVKFDVKDILPQLCTDQEQQQAAAAGRAAVMKWRHSANSTQPPVLTTMPIVLKRKFFGQILLREQSWLNLQAAPLLEHLHIRLALKSRGAGLAPEPHFCGIADQLLNMSTTSLSVLESEVAKVF
eukprot:m.230900 g.230900  ORF g.230900 m.230900 type:complete len:232 (+) comp10869_c7_seq5:1674-2369(+)